MESSYLEELAPFFDELPSDFEILDQIEGPLSAAIATLTVTSLTTSTPATPNQVNSGSMNEYNFRGLTFPLTGFFDGKGSEPAERWLRRFDVEILGFRLGQNSSRVRGRSERFQNALRNPYAVSRLWNTLASQPSALVDC